MWCLETIVELNKKVESGMSPKEAYEACGIKSISEVYSPQQKEDPAVFGTASSIEEKVSSYKKSK